MLTGMLIGACNPMPCPIDGAIQALWNGSSLSPMWFPNPSTSQYVELYDHQFDTGPIGAKIWDDFENVNEAEAHPDLVSSLSAQVRTFYDNVAAARGQPYGR